MSLGMRRSLSEGMPPPVTTPNHGAEACPGELAVDAGATQGLSWTVVPLFPSLTCGLSVDDMDGVDSSQMMYLCLLL
jgi:hypothetical protein